MLRIGRYKLKIWIILTDMRFLIQDMIQSSLSSFASQFKSVSGGKGDSSQYRGQQISRDTCLDCADPSEGEEGEGRIPP